MVEKATDRPVILGVALKDLRTYGALVHELAVSPLVANTEFTVQAPLYKGTAEIKQALTEVGSALEKFEVYIAHTILNEQVRVQMAQAFRRRYLARHPMSEGSDIFLASGEVLSFSFTMQQPKKLMKVVSLKGAISSHPHDSEVLRELQSGNTVDRTHLTGSLRIFLDNVYNPRRRQDPVMAPLLTGELGDDPVILELYTNGAVPGLFIRFLGFMLHEMGVPHAVALLHG
jgi:hypothetical protein